MPFIVCLHCFCQGLCLSSFSSLASLNLVVTFLLCVIYWCGASVFVVLTTMPWIWRAFSLSLFLFTSPLIFFYKTPLTPTVGHKILAAQWVMWRAGIHSFCPSPYYPHPSKTGSCFTFYQSLFYFSIICIGRIEPAWLQFCLFIVYF